MPLDEKSMNDEWSDPQVPLLHQNIRKSQDSLQKKHFQLERQVPAVCQKG
jgi:hypothetical protein